VILGGRLALAGVALVGLAATWPGPGARIAKAASPTAGDGPAQVAVFLVVDTPIANKVQAVLLRGLEAALKDNERLDVRDKELLLAEFAGEVPEAQIDAARARYREGLEALAQGQADVAADKLAAAERAFEPVLGFVKKNELADTQFHLGAALAVAGEAKKARAAFVRLLVWRPSYEWDPERWRAVLPLIDEAKAEIESAGRGSLEILSEPEGAMAFVDGKYVGTTPASADGLPAGDHFVTLKLEGYQRRVIKAKVDTRYQELVTEMLPPSEKYLLVRQSLARARAHLGQEVADVAIVDLRTFLFIDMAVLVLVEPGTAGALALTAFVYDLRSKRLLGQSSGSVDPAAPAEAERKLAELGRALFVGVRYDGARPDGPRRRSGRDDGPARPFYRTWWFWTAVAAGTAAVITPIVFYDDLTGSEPASCPSGTVCTGVKTSF
jgi:tetratricopeptide (TPR) repeat protein